MGVYFGEDVYVKGVHTLSAKHALSIIFKLTKNVIEESVSDVSA